jgi:hypothetical protein
VRIERGGVEISDGILVTGREEITGVRIILGKGTGVIRGQVQAPGGALPDGWSMSVMARREKAAGMAPDFSGSSGGGAVDIKGRFVIEGLLPGEYELTLMAMAPAVGDPNSRLQVRSPEVRQKVKVIVAKGQESQVTMTLDLSK